MYFLAKIHGKNLIDPFMNDPDNLELYSDSSSDNVYDKDS